MIKKTLLDIWVRLKIIVNLNLIFIYTTTINKQVLHLILISLLVTDVSARVSLIWEEGGVPLRTHVSKGDQISVAAVRSECIVHYATWTQNMLKSNKCECAICTWTGTVCWGWRHQWCPCLLHQCFGNPAMPIVNIYMFL